MTKNSNTQEDDGVGIANVPPYWQLCGVCELLLQLRLLFCGQLDAFLLLQAAEAHHCLLAHTWFLLGFCNGRDKGDEENLLVLCVNV